MQCCLTRRCVSLSYILFLTHAKNELGVATNIGNSLTQDTMDLAGFMSTQSVSLSIMTLVHVEG
jgi:hypothetical protein